MEKGGGEEDAENGLIEHLKSCWCEAGKDILLGFTEKIARLEKEKVMDEKKWARLEEKMSPLLLIHDFFFL